MADKPTNSKAVPKYPQGPVRQQKEYAATGRVPQSPAKGPSGPRTPT